MYCMIKGNHVYTLNYELKVLNHKLENDDSDKVKLKVSNEYYINEDKTPIECKMISNVDDLLLILKEKQNEKREDKEIINLIYKSNDLTQLIFELKEIGYEPSIKRQACRITLLCLTFGKICFIIKSQQLIPDEMDGDISVSSDIVYNNVNRVFTTFNNQIFKKDYLSFYSNQDVAILNESRTVVPCGYLRKIDCNIENVIEIDISKAFSFAFSAISEIPVFNEFDIWKNYSPSILIKDLTLYIVYVEKANLFFNKNYNLVYGKFLKKFVKTNIKIFTCQP